MNDLISRKKIHDYIKGEINPYGKPFEGTAYELGLKIMRYIDSIDSAYSVEKVVEELEELDVKSITRYKNGNFGDFDGIEYYIKKREAIEIVKQGIVADDMCEWKQTSTARYKTSCGYKVEEYFDTKACYCKQCGKKIKIVGGGIDEI